MKIYWKISILLTVVVFIGGYMIYANSNNQNDNNDDSGKVSVNSAVSSGTTFTIDEYNYTVIFPEGWEIVDNLGDYVSWMGPVAQEQEEVTELLQGMKIEIWTTDMIGVTLEEAVEAELAIYSPDEILDRTDMTVDGQDAVKVKTFVMGYTIATYILKDDVLYKFIGYVGDDTENAKYVAQYSSILNTFEFTK